MTFQPMEVPVSLRWKGRVIAMVALLALLVAVVAFATSIGSVEVPLSTTFKVILNRLPFINIAQSWEDGVETIICDLRLPRVILAGLAGAALSIAGATYQGLFRNPLADPYLIGVAQGAALGAVTGYLLPVSLAGAGIGLVPLLAFTARC
jgi:iron complex transport system permease protein